MALTLHKSHQCIHFTLQYIILIGQLFGLLPVHGVLSSVDRLHFKWKSWKMCYNFMLMAVIVVAAILNVIRFSTKPTFVELDTLVFKLSAISNLIAHISIAKKWSILIVQGCKSDQIMYNRYGPIKNLNTRIILILGYFFVIVIVFTVFFHDIINLNRNSVSYDELSTVIFLQVVNYVAFFLVTFNDAFIIAVSSLFALRFRQIRVHLEVTENEPKAANFWHQIRQDYDRLSYLCKELDNSFGAIIFTSYACNGYFLLTYLYHSLRQHNTDRLFYLSCCFFLLFKFISLCSYISWINDESTEPATVLNSVSSDSYNSEIMRLLTQISFDDNALTGFKIFKVTKGFLLSIISTIVTYELVLIQFNTFHDSTNA